MEEALIKKLMSSLECGVCKQRYEGDSINVLGHHENLWLLSAFCLACHTRCLVVAVIKQDKESEATIDLTEVELDKFRNMGSVTADDLLDMHSFLKDFGGDFSWLFNQKEA